MSESYIKAEIVRSKLSTPEAFGKILGWLGGLATRVLVVWWFFAAWFPELGLTYWQVVLPVYAVRMLVTSNAILGRPLK
jgi:hypothetical protein